MDQRRGEWAKGKQRVKVGVCSMHATHGDDRRQRGWEGSEVGRSLAFIVLTSTRCVLFSFVRSLAGRVMCVIQAMEAKMAGAMEAAIQAHEAAKAQWQGKGAKYKVKRPFPGACEGKNTERGQQGGIRAPKLHSLLGAWRKSKKRQPAIHPTLLASSLNFSPFIQPHRNLSVLSILNHSTNRIEHRHTTTNRPASGFWRRRTHGCTPGWRLWRRRA